MPLHVRFTFDTFLCAALAAVAVVVAKAPECADITQLLTTSYFIGPGYDAALLFSGPGSIVMFVLLFSQQIREGLVRVAYYPLMWIWIHHASPFINEKQLKNFTRPSPRLCRIPWQFHCHILEINLLVGIQANTDGHNKGFAHFCYHLQSENNGGKIIPTCRLSHKKISILQ